MTSNNKFKEICVYKNGFGLIGLDEIIVTDEFQGLRYGYVV